MARTKRDLDYLLLIAGGECKHINDAVMAAMDRVELNYDLIFRKRPALERIYANHNGKVEIQFRAKNTVMLRFAHDYLKNRSEPFFAGVDILEMGTTKQNAKIYYHLYKLDDIPDEIVESVYNQGNKPPNLYNQIVDKVYFPGYEPPGWVSTNRALLLNKYGSSAHVLYMNDFDEETITKLATNREPVNIEMQRTYHMDILKQLAGYETGAYKETVAAALGKDALLPSMAVVCTTPIVLPDDDAQSNITDRVIAVVNLIGIAFDAINQPDRTYFTNLDHTYGGDPRLMRAYVRMWCLAFDSVIKLHRHVLCASPVGDVSFKPNGIDVNTFRKLYFYTAIKRVYGLHDRYKKVRVEWMPFYPRYDVPYSLVGLEDHPTHKKQAVNLNMSQADLDDRVFVNAWDPWSVPGNGNSMDGSADGWWGRSTAISLLGWPLVNPYVEYVPITDPWKKNIKKSIPNEYINIVITTPTGEVYQSRLHKDNVIDGSFPRLTNNRKIFSYGHYARLSDDRYHANNLKHFELQKQDFVNQTLFVP